MTVDWVVVSSVIVAQGILALGFIASKLLIKYVRGY